MAVERVEALLLSVTQALENAGIAYAVIGGNAVAAWVATVDDGATRATKDVDLLVRREDMPRIVEAAASLGLYADEAAGFPVLLDRRNPKPSQGVHLIYAAERLGAGDQFLAPAVESSSPLTGGLRVISLIELVRMKLIAYRLRDRVHLQDMFGVGLLTPELARRLPDELREKLRAVRDEMEWHAPKPEF